MKTVVIVSLNFPPSQIASVHRARHLAKWLPSHGWTPIVIAVRPDFQKEPPDPELATLVPNSVDVRWIDAVPFRSTALVGLGDLGLRALPYLYKELERIIANERVDAVMFTGWPFYQMLLTRRIAKRHKVPVLVDFQDPWASRHGRNQALLSKAGLSHRLAVALEPMVLRHASYITSVSDVQNAELAARYPWLDPDRMFGIPIGGDEEDFGAIRNGLRIADCVALPTELIHLSYVGTALPRSGPLIRTVFRAFRRLREESPDFAARVRLNFIGTSNQQNGHSNFCVKPIAAEEDVLDHVTEIPQRIPYLDALQVLAVSHGILLIGSDEPHYTASKIYPALMSRTRFLSLFHKDSSADEILRRAGGGFTFSFASLEQLDATIPELSQGLQRLAGPLQDHVPADPSSFAHVTARAISARYAAIFDRIASAI